uniref:Uncharacterized protein n=1 Tax=Anopheles dirus TaxID=7168 RepID=A0A182NXX9_9DIPT
MVSVFCGLPDSCFETGTRVENTTTSASLVAPLGLFCWFCWGKREFCGFSFCCDLRFSVFVFVIVIRAQLLCSPRRNRTTNPCHAHTHPDTHCATWKVVSVVSAPPVHPPVRAGSAISNGTLYTFRVKGDVLRLICCNISVGSATWLLRPRPARLPL